MLFALLGLHAVLALVAPMAAPRLRRRVLLLCALAPAATTAWAATVAPAVLSGGAVTEQVEWAPVLGLTAELRLDAFALAMVALVSGIGTLIFCYAAAYFPDATSGLGRFAASLTAFAGAMLGLVLADNLLVLYVFWEATSVTSYLLIGFEDAKGSARAAALQALLVTSAGGLAMLAGFVLLGQAAGSYSLSGLLAEPPAGGVVTAGLLLVLVGAVTKSAQVPFHVWLPNAMAAPTPVSAYLHSAAMVKAGVYVIARFAPAFALVPLWRPLVIGVGVASMIWAGLRALRQDDLKLLLAFGTVSQLGFLIALFGAGTPEATLAGVVLLLAHGAFKATLFMVAGIVDHQTGTRDLRRLSGVGRRMPLLCGVATVATASMVGLPPLLGFLAKEAAFEAYLHGGLGLLGPLALSGLVAGSVLTFAYSARFLLGAFATKRPPRPSRAGATAARPSSWFLAPPALLSFASIVTGLWPGLVSPLSIAAAAGLDPAVDAEPLRLWHGLTPALGLSALVVALGLLAVALAARLQAIGRRVAGWPGGDEAYQRSLRGLNHLADRTTGLVQNGSLPIYLGVILLTSVMLPGAALLAGDAWRAEASPGIALAESPLQAVVAVAIAVTALVTPVVRRRLVAVLCLGGVGYGVAVLFVLQGAPDLALTQLLIETLVIVIFVLVLRHLPDEFSHHRWLLGQTLRKVVATAVAVFVFAFALLAGAARRQPPVSDEFLARALPEAGGRNVVNVILVDFRGFDTFGEITVLMVAALGIAGLLRAVRLGRETQAEHAEPGEEREQAGVAGGQQAGGRP